MCDCEEDCKFTNDYHPFCLVYKVATNEDDDDRKCCETDYFMCLVGACALAIDLSLIVPCLCGLGVKKCLKCVKYVKSEKIEVSQVIVNTQPIASTTSDIITPAPVAASSVVIAAEVFSPSD